MNMEDIKIGETYNVRVTVEDKSDKVWIQVRTSESAYPNVLAASEAEAFSPISPENGIKNTENTPKYDQNRLFRKGDKVEHHPRNGRRGASDIPNGKTLTVTADEVLYDWIYLTDGDNDYSCDPAYLELVTPVEELEPYYIEKHGEKPGGLCYTVHKHGGYAESSFYYGTCRTRDEAQAKARAEAERDRLNEEWRKEMEK